MEIALPKGPSYYRPNGKRIYGRACCGAAETNEADFNAHAFDLKISAINTRTLTTERNHD